MRAIRPLIFVSGGGALGFVLAVVLGFVLGNGGGAKVDLATAAPAIPVAAEAPPSQPAPQARTGAPAAAAQAPAPATQVLHFASDPTRSSAKIIVMQTGLLGDATLVANGSNVSGDIYLTPSGGLGETQSGFQLDLRTLKASDSALSAFLRSDLEADRFPHAVFVAESLSGVPATYMDGNEFSFTMTGPLTMHGQTRQTTWTGKGRQSGNFLTFVADTDFLLTDYGWNPPNYGVARAKNSVHLQVVVIAGKAE